MKKTLLFITFLFYVSILFSQEALKSTEEEYYDFLALDGITERPTLGYRTLSDSVWEIKEEKNHIWKNNNLGCQKVLWESENQGNNWFTKGFFHGTKIKIFGPEWFNSFNTTAPYGQNDGALWQGKGYNTSFSTGIKVESFGFELTVKPQISFSQNLEYDFLPGVFGNENSYFWGYGIDLVQRFGNKSFTNFDLGDTEIRYTFHTLTVGFGFQSPWLGPSYINPMLGSNNAPTYPNFDIGFRKTKLVIPGVNWYIGDFESRIWIGQLTESIFFDNNNVIDKNLIFGFNFSYTPSFWKNFTIGVTKICTTKWGNDFFKYLNPFYSNNDVHGIGEDQKSSIYATVLFPSVGFELYGEIGTDDYIWDNLSSLKHTMIYTVGAKKTFNISDKCKALVLFEWNDFEMSQDFQLQWNYMGYYAHHQIKEGYTQKGQLLAGAYSYFGDSQLLKIKLFFPKSSHSVFVHRFCPDINYVYNKAVNDIATDGNLEHLHTLYRTYFTIGLENTVFISDSFFINLEYNFTQIRHFFYKKDSSSINHKFVIELKYVL